MKDLINVTHESIPLFINPDSKVLILGSLPSVKSREDGFYYAFKRNRFFLALASLFDEDEPVTIEERKAFLKRHNIALYDVIYECDIHGSSDSSITNVKVIDIKSILEKYPSIKAVGINGGKAKELFDKYLLKDIPSNVKVIYLPSTSPANARMNVSELKEHFSKLFNK